MRDECTLILALGTHGEVQPCIALEIASGEAIPIQQA